jgi:hypothetical protein
VDFENIACEDADKCILRKKLLDKMSEILQYLNTASALNCIPSRQAESRNSGKKREQAAVTRQRHGKHVSAATNKYVTIEDEILSKRSAPRLQLAVAR